MSLRQRYGTPVALAIVLALVVKALILYGLWYAFISAPHSKQTRTPPARVEPTLPAPPASSPSQRP
jgi:hypothetical protein